MRCGSSGGPPRGRASRTWRPPRRRPRPAPRRSRRPRPRAPRSGGLGDLGADPVARDQRALRLARHGRGHLLFSAPLRPGSSCLDPAAPPLGGPTVAIELLCRKLGMTRIFDEAGDAVAGDRARGRPERRAPEEDRREGRLHRAPARLRRAPPRRRSSKADARPLREGEGRPAALRGASAASGPRSSPSTRSAASSRPTCSAPGQRIDVIGTSKGRGTAGVVRRYHFRLQKWTHGTHEGFRRTAARSAPTPTRATSAKGKKMYGRMGNERVTTRNVSVVRVDAEQEPAARPRLRARPHQALVRIRPAVAAKRVAVAKPQPPPRPRRSRPRDGLRPQGRLPPAREARGLSLARGLQAAGDPARAAACCARGAARRGPRLLAGRLAPGGGRGGRARGPRGRRRPRGDRRRRSSLRT